MRTPNEKWSRDEMMSDLQSDTWYNLKRHSPITDDLAPLVTAEVVSQCVGGASTMTNHSNIPDSIQPNTIEIPLSKSYVAVVDECDADLSDMLWHVIESCNHVYGSRYSSVGGGKRKRIYLHQIILSRILGRPLAKGEMPDHINNNGLDNRRENIRLATRFQNNCNRRISVNNTTGFKGVVWRPRIKRFQAKIRVNGKQKNLGHYLTPEAAHAAYIEAAKHHFGEFANDGSGPVQS
jgi:hypothetical protein